MSKSIHMPQKQCCEPSGFIIISLTSEDGERFASDYDYDSIMQAFGEGNVIIANYRYDGYGGSTFVEREPYSGMLLVSLFGRDFCMRFGNEFGSCLL